ncbi:MAG: ribonuclease III [Clostridia bacterium]|nr:ribonuclease III [Clostridia bacterium]
MDIKDFQKSLGYSFKNEELLITALTHTSYAHERHVESYERLEFLGDAVLQMLTSMYIYKTYSDFPEGKMSRMRANIVCEETLSRIAEKLEVGKHARLGKGEELTGGRERASILADMVEAILAAIYLDGGIDKAREVIFDAYGHIIENAAEGRLNRDYKTMLQEKLQKEGSVLIEYLPVKEEGPAHNKVFTMAVSLNNKILGTGSGRTKQEAQQMAAKAALGDKCNG